MTDYKNTIDFEKKRSVEKIPYSKVSGEKLERVARHQHNGLDSHKIKPENLSQSFIKIVSSEPTEAPKTYTENIQMKSDGTELYVWDNESSVWRKFNYYTP